MSKLPAPALPDWLRALLPFERYGVQVGDHAIHVMEAGDPAGRPVLMLHGNPTWGFLWRKVARALAHEKLRLVMPDLVGLGLSDKPRQPAFHQLRTHGQLMAGVIDALRLGDLIVARKIGAGPWACTQWPSTRSDCRASCS